MSSERQRKTIETTIRVAVRNVATGDQSHYLVVRDGPRLGYRFEVGSKPIVIGRSESADIDLNDPSVSGRHCSVMLGLGRVMIHDLGSTNGTFLDGEKIDEPVDFPVGATLQIGATALEHELRSKREIQQQEHLASDLDKAAAYVESLLPEPFSNDWITTDWRFVPSAKLGGDSFGFHWLDENRFAIYLFDVCGHGAGSALHSVSIANTVRKQALPSTDFGDPAGVLTRLNETFKMDDHAGMYFTAWYGIYDALERRLTFASAGHPPAILMASDGGPETSLRPLRTAKPPIGLVPEIEYVADELVLEAGSNRLFVYSDGAFEVRVGADDEFWTLEGFIDLLADAGLGPIEKEAARIETGVRSVMSPQAFEDDFSILIADFHP